MSSELQAETTSQMGNADGRYLAEERTALHSFEQLLQQTPPFNSDPALRLLSTTGVVLWLRPLPPTSAASSRAACWQRSIQERSCDCWRPQRCWLHRRPTNVVLVRSRTGLCREGRSLPASRSARSSRCSRPERSGWVAAISRNQRKLAVGLLRRSADFRHPGKKRCVAFCAFFGYWPTTRSSTSAFGFTTWVDLTRSRFISIAV